MFEMLVASFVHCIECKFDAYKDQHEPFYNALSNKENMYTYYTYKPFYDLMY